MELFLDVDRNSPASTIIQRFQDYWDEDPLYAIRSLFYLRDYRNGKGERRPFIICMVYLKFVNEQIYNQISSFIPLYGYWRDFLCIYKYATNIGLSGNHEITMFATQINEDLKSLKNNEPLSLAAKWAPNEKSRYKKFAFGLMKMLDMDPKEYRKCIVKLRSKLNVLEQNITNRDYERINFSEIPALAHVKYKDLFLRNHNSKLIKSEFNKQLNKKYLYYIDSLKDGSSDIKTDGLSLGDIIRLEDSLQWNYMILKYRHMFKNTLVIYDLDHIGNNKRVSDLAIGFSIMVSECCENKYFSNKILSFGDNCRMYNLDGLSLSNKIKILKTVSLGSVESMDMVLKKLLGVAKNLNIPKNEMVDTVIVVSNLKFSNVDLGSIKNKFKESGYEFPKLVYWVPNGVSRFVIEGDFHVLGGMDWEIMNLDPGSYMNMILGYYPGAVDIQDIPNTKKQEFLNLFKDKK